MAAIASHARAAPPPRSAGGGGGGALHPARLVHLSSAAPHRLPLAPRRLGAATLRPAPAAAAAAPLEPLEPDGIIAPDGTVEKRAPLDPEARAALWRAAVKLPMYSVAAAPVLVSAAAAFVYAGGFSLARTAALLAAAVAVVGWLNLSNDVFDSLTGVDAGGRKPESVVELTGSRARVLAAAAALLLAGGGALFSLAGALPTPWPARALYAAICAGYLYQGPPFRWGYVGLGEPLCFAAFGPLATCALYLAQVPAAAATPAGPGLGATLALLPAPVLALSCLVGATTTAVLFCSHFHQVAGDAAAGKRSPLVRLGTRRGAELLKAGVGAVYTLTLVLSLMGVLPFAAWTSVMVVYGMASEAVRLAEAYPDDPARLRGLKALAVRWHAAFSGMLIVGLLVKKAMVM
jgi:1,4-dihydroxy-2-naphthoate phytyltransferase